MGKNLTFNYLNRDFESLKTDLQTYVQTYYPDQYNDFSESSVGMMLLELNAYVGDILSYHVESNFKEVFIDTAVNRSSVIQLAKNLGYNPRGKTGAVTVLDVSINVPTLGDSYDPDYLITLETGFRAKGTNGSLYETREPIDFSSHYSVNGTVNRTIVPVYNTQNEIVSYKITKSILGFAGQSVVKTLEVENNMGVPFLQWNVDDEDTSIVEVKNLVTTDTRFPPGNEADWTEAGDNLVWYEMKSLAQERTFIDTSISGDVSEGYWHYTAQRFIKEWDENGNLIITFGAGVKDYDNYEYFQTYGISGMTPESLLNNDSLGSIPEPGTYLHVRYVTGGGLETNIGMNQINRIDYYGVDYVPGGAGVDPNDYNNVINSLAVNNSIPAIGGRDFETVEEIKEYAKLAFSSQDRCVTIEDYITKIQEMPGKYGSVFRSHAQADPTSMNTALYLLTRDENGNLKNTGNDTIKYNVANYLSQYKVLNDFVNIYDGRIINIGINFSVQIHSSYNKREVLVNIMKMLKEYFAIENWHMNQTIYISQVNEMIREQAGVINVVSLEFVNKVGGDYSSDVLAINNANPEIDMQDIQEDGEVVMTPVNNSIKAPITGMFEIKYPSKDIKGSVL